MLSLFLAAALLQPADNEQQIEGAITPSDTRVSGEHYDAYEVDMRGGQRTLIRVFPRNSAVFGLTVHSRDGSRTLAIAEGMQLGWTPPADGTYIVRIASDQFGPYTLRVSDSAPGRRR